MKLAISGDVVHVTLSARNVKALEHKLEMPGSKRTIYKTFPGAKKFVVHVEPDEDHYGDTVPGVMHPATEAFIGRGGPHDY